jgi:hypothetical protein
MMAEVEDEEALFCRLGMTRDQYSQAVRMIHEWEGSGESPVELLEALLAILRARR